MNIALITGASSGLGAKYIEAVSEQYRNLDEIWLIARRKERMEQFAAEHTGLKLRPIAMDLSEDESYGRLKRLLDEEKAVIRVLVNNAGYEKSGRFDEMDESAILSMVNLNVKGFTMVNRICVSHMEGGSIGVMTCSVSAFTPIPHQAVYSSSKAYVQHFSRAFHEEVKSKGIKILMMCPGNMDTEMNPKGVGRQSRRINSLPFLDMNVITRKSLMKAEIGHAIYTPGGFYKIYRFLCKVLPKALMGKIAARAYK